MASFKILLCFGVFMVLVTVSLAQIFSIDYDRGDRGYGNRGYGGYDNGRYGNDRYDNDRYGYGGYGNRDDYGNRGYGGLQGVYGPQGFGIGFVPPQYYRR